MAPNIFKQLYVTHVPFEESSITSLHALPNKTCATYVEWNNKFYNLVGHYHPSIWHVVHGFSMKKRVRTIILQMLLADDHKKKFVGAKSKCTTSSKFDKKTTI